MDTTSESCEPPPCDPQPPGKIRKALKLFSKRKPGSSVASIFSIRGKGEGETKSPPSRSKTLDGLTETVPPEAEAESVDLDQEDSQKEDAPMEETTSKEGNLESTPARQSISSLTSAKSLSFLNMLRRSRKGGERLAQTESQRPGRQRKSLKGLFGSVRWHGKDKEGGDEVALGPPLLASRSNSVEIIKENLTLTPRPAPRSPDESEIQQQPLPSQDEPASSEDITKVSESAKRPTNDRLSALLGDISSILSFDSLTSAGDIIADVEAEWVKVSSRVEDTDEMLKKDKAFEASTSTKQKPTLSPTSTLSSSSSPKPSPTSTAKLYSPLTTFPKPIPSPTSKPILSPASAPSPTIIDKPTSSLMSAPILTTTKEPEPSSPPTLAPIPVPSAKPTHAPVTIPEQCPPSIPTSAVLNKPALIPTSTPVLEPTSQPKPSAGPDLTPAAVSGNSISNTYTFPPEPAAHTAVRTESNQIPAAATKPTPAPALTHTTKSTHSVAQETKHSSAPAPKYPPFSTSTKPATTAPVTRPKIVTTFGLSTSRNTAPIVKPDTKQPASQTKSSPPLSQTNKSESASTTAKAPNSESRHAHTAKLPLATSPPHYGPPVTRPQTTLSKSTAENATQPSVLATSAKPVIKPEPADTSLLSGSPPLPNLSYSPRPPPTIPPFAAPCSNATGEEKEQELMAMRGVMEETGIYTLPQKVEPHSAAQDQMPITYTHKPEKKSIAVKPTALSKIPVSGGGRPKQHHRDGHSNGDEEHWNLPTPVHEEESPIPLSRESSSKDPLSDFSTGSGAITPTLSHSQEDMDSAAHPITGPTSLPRESKIPVKPGSTASYHSLQGRTEAARSKIPVSKVPIRRTSNKPAPTAAAAATRK
ncbi:APC membrane recruitment protein 2 [Hoplias malabaricus]|uniref:APC membrane recruitment protein 2 n=1 Tax=Hoplias malabaricus TaxID=27720 RepID=UPI003461E55D